MNRKITKKSIWILITISLLGLFTIVYNRNTRDNATKTIINYKTGTANYCKINPHFIQQLHIPQPVYIDMTQTRGKGLVMISAIKNAKPFQLPSWDDAGYLGPYALDEMGNIYVAPIPFVSIEEYPPKTQNVIYRVNSETGDLKEFMKIPWASPPNENNPFNILGLNYDCDTKSLYVASVSGSSFEHEIGRIYQIDVQSKTITDQIEEIDAIGLGIYNKLDQKILYIGMARTPDIYSILLDSDGHFIQKPKFEFSLNELNGGSYDKCHRIRFLRKNKMELKAIEFNYTLHAESEVQRNIYNFEYDVNNKNWKFLEVHKQ